jgi:antitoxin (DNA-binding transcriptional repressor) of toxin-antitoxin stability system
VGMKTVGVRDLKIHLSAHLRDVARGDVILVTDRSRVVAELRSPGANRDSNLSPDALLRQRLVERGLLKQAPPLGRPMWKVPLPRLLRQGSAQELLDAEREDRSL